MCVLNDYIIVASIIVIAITNSINCAALHSRQLYVNGPLCHTVRWFDSIVR